MISTEWNLKQFRLHLHIWETWGFSFLKVCFLVFYISAKGLKLNLCRKAIKGVYEYMQLLLIFSLRQSEFPWQLVNLWNLELQVRPKANKSWKNLSPAARQWDWATSALLKHFNMDLCTSERKYFNQSSALVFTNWDCAPLVLFVLCFQGCTLCMFYPCNSMNIFPHDIPGLLRNTHLKNLSVKIASK